MFGYFRNRPNISWSLEPPGAGEVEAIQDVSR